MPYNKPMTLAPTRFKFTIDDFYALDSLGIFTDHNVQEYWVADLNHRTWFIYRDPQGDDYQFKTTYRFGEAFAPLAFPGIAQPWLAE